MTEDDRIPLAEVIEKFEPSSKWQGTFPKTTS